MSTKAKADTYLSYSIQATDSFKTKEIWVDGELRRLEFEHISNREIHDTVYKTKDSIVYKSKVDSIPYIVEVPVEVEVERKWTLGDYLKLVSVGIVVFFLGRFSKRFS